MRPANASSHDNCVYSGYEHNYEIFTVVLCEGTFLSIVLGDVSQHIVVLIAGFGCSRAAIAPQEIQQAGTSSKFFTIIN